MTFNCIAIGVVPATGKSNLINTLYNNINKNNNFKSGLIRGHHIKEYNLLIVGIYNTFKKFKGTDLLSMSAHNDFKKLIDLNKYNIIFEGDRLFSNSILEYVKNTYNLTTIVLTADENILKDRHKDRNDSQTDKFLKGRKTKIENIINNKNIKPLVLKNNNIEDMSSIYDMIVARIKKFK